MSFSRDVIDIPGNVPGNSKSLYYHFRLCVTFNWPQTGKAGPFVFDRKLCLVWCSPSAVLRPEVLSNS